MGDTARILLPGDLPLGHLFRVEAVATMMVRELHHFVPDEGGRRRLAAVHDRAVEELEVLLPRELADELRALRAGALADTCTLGEIRVAQAQLLGWVEGVLSSVVMEIGGFDTEPGLGSAE